MELFASFGASSSSKDENVSIVNVDTKESSFITLGKDHFSRINNFKDLGLCDWVLNVTKSVGYKHPTEIQKQCIPAILRRRDVLAGAETGSGKTASYILPLLQILSEDPYGIFAVVLAPTRELAIQISDQITILGSSAAVSVCQIVGGYNFVEQSLQLSRRPHFVVATPGRFRQHLETASPPNLSKVQFFIMDEADKLISTGFAEDLEVIISKMNPNKTTGFFSATVTNSLIEIGKFALKENYQFIDLTEERKIPTQLVQSYLVTPAKIKICYLIALLFHIFHRNISHEKKNDKDLDEDEEFLNLDAQMNNVKKFMKKNKKNAKNNKSNHNNHKKESDEEIINMILNKKTINNDDDGDEGNTGRRGKKDLIIIFVDTCQKCYEINEILHKFQFESVALHSLMTQSQRIHALQLFKSLQSNILIATDIASRGLDIPDVNYVINFNLPKILSDYIHRVGKKILIF